MLRSDSWLQYIMRKVKQLVDDFKHFTEAKVLSSQSGRALEGCRLRAGFHSLDSIV